LYHRQSKGVILLMAKLARGVPPVIDIPLPMNVGSGHVSYVTSAHSEEASQLEALIMDVIASWYQLGDPYFSASSGDQFEYRSVLGARRCSVPVKLHFRGRAPALPMDET
jgi:hypothetical protein